MRLVSAGETLVLDAEGEILATESMGGWGELPLWDIFETQLSERRGDREMGVKGRWDCTC